MNTRHGVRADYNHREFVDALREALGLAPIFRADRVTIRTYARVAFEGRVLPRSPSERLTGWSRPRRWEQTITTSKHNSRDERTRLS